MTKSWRKAAMIATAVAVGVLATPAIGQDRYPNKPIRLVVPFPAGGSTDIIGRLVAQKLSERLGQQVIVDNRGGAGGTIGTDNAAKSPADGYTLLLSTTSTLAVAPAAYSKLAYDPVRDDPLLVPSWTTRENNRDTILRALTEARDGRIVVLTLHGVPDTAHPWVTIPVALFEEYLRALRDGGFRVVALRDVARYLPAGRRPPAAHATPP